MYSYPVASYPRNDVHNALPKNYKVDWWPKNSNNLLPVALSCITRNVNFPFARGPAIPSAVSLCDNLMCTSIGLKYLSPFSTFLTHSSHHGPNPRRPWVRLISCQKKEGDDANALQFEELSRNNDEADVDWSSPSGSVNDEILQWNWLHATKHEPDFVFGVISLICDVVNIKTGKSIRTRILIDDGSNINVVERSLADKIGLTLDCEDIDVSFRTTGSVLLNYNNEKQVKFCLRAIDNSYTSPPISATTLPKVSAAFSKIDVVPEEFGHLKGLTFTERLPHTKRSYRKYGKVEVLIGLPMAALLQCGVPICGQEEYHPIAFPYKLGMALAQAYHRPEEKYSGNSLFVEAQGPPDLTRLMSLEVIGIKENPEDEEFTYAQSEAVRILNEKTKYDTKSKTYITSLPWTKEGPPPCTNRGPAEQFATRLARKLEKAPQHIREGWLNAYSALIEQNFCRPATQEEQDMVDGYHILITFCVAQPKPTHPFRLCFVPNTKLSHGRTYNSHLHTGPNLLAYLGQVILKIRQARFIFILDIFRMFHRFRLDSQSQQMCRFYMLKQCEDGKIRYSQYVATCLVFGLSTSPFIATHLLRLHAKKYQDHPDPIVRRASSELIRNSYVDDICCLIESPEMVVPIVKAVQWILSEASLDTYKYASNCKDALKEFADLALPDSKCKILGVAWDSDTDEITFNMISPPQPKYMAKDGIDEEEIVKISSAEYQSKAHADQKEKSSLKLPEPDMEGRYTKRQVLSTSARIWDIHGLACPYTILPRCLLQSLWAKGVQWDSPMDSEDNKSFLEFLKELPLLENMVFPRCFTPSPDYTIVEMACFGDASNVAFGCACYLVSVHKTTGQRYSTLAFAKNRVKPLSKGSLALDNPAMTICRLELISSVVTVLAARFIKNALVGGNDLKVRYFSDSQVTLHRINNDYTTYTTFTANRLKMILDNSTPDDWFCVPSKDNPADLCSRGCLLSELSESQLWSRGPSFLTDKDWDYDEMRIKRIVLSREQRNVEHQELKKVHSPFEVAHFHHSLGCTPYYESHITTRGQKKAEAAPTSTSDDKKEAKAAPKAASNISTEEELDQAIEEEEQQAQEDALLPPSAVASPPPFMDKDYFVGPSGLLSRFNNWNLLVRVMGRVLRFVDVVLRSIEATRSAKNLEDKMNMDTKKKVGRVRPTRRSRRTTEHGIPGTLPSPLDPEDITRSELFLFRLAQALGWSQEIKLLKNREPLPKGHPLAIKAAFWDAQVSLIMIPGRKPAPDLIALPKHSLVADMYLRNLHLHQDHHLPVNELIATAQRRVYIFGGRPAFKKAMHGCSCRNPIDLEQQFAELPLFRTEIRTDCYQYCAADYAGPFLVYPNPRSTRGQKCWILLVTCLVTRHLSIEVVEDCSTAAFIRAIRRHIATFGHFAKIFTDNATYFVSGEDQMKRWLQSLSWRKIQTDTTTAEPRSAWHFWTSRASSKAGCVERIVGIFKNSLYRAFLHKSAYEMKAKFTPSEFRTIAKECAGLVNHRPLSYVSVDDHNALTTDVVVTPSMMVIGRDLEILPKDFRFQKSSEFRKVLRNTGQLKDINKVYHQRQVAMDVFWNSFESQYLEQLKLPRKFFRQFEHEIPPGTFVLLKEPGFKKQKFLPCIVVGVNKRPDGLINSLDVKCTEYATTITRDIRAFALMESDFQKITGDQSHRLATHDLDSHHLQVEYNIPSSNSHQVDVVIDSYSLNLLLKAHFDGTH